MHRIFLVTSFIFILFGCWLSPYLSIALTMAYLSLVARDFCCFLEFSSRESWRPVTSPGYRLKNNQKLLERKFSTQTTPAPLSQYEQISTKRTLKLSDARELLNLEFISLHYCLEGNFFDRAEGAPVQRVLNTIRLRHSSFLESTYGSDETIICNERDQEASFIWLGVFGSITYKFYVELGESHVVPVILFLGYREEVDELKIRQANHLLSSLRHTLDQEILLKGTREAIKQKDALISHLGHDLRSPLSNIRSILELLKVESAATADKQLLEDGLENCDSLAELISDILYMSRGNQDQIEVERVEVAIREKCSNLQNHFSSTAKQNGIDLKQGEIPDVSLLVDQSHFQRILSNLISNSIKYSQTGDSCTISGELDCFGNLVLKVEDTGLGMTEEQIQVAFQPFKRLHKSVSDGVGLGMVIMKMLVDANGGRIDVCSSPGKGTTVKILFPEAYVRQQASSYRVGQIQSEQTFNARRVLLVDDEAGVTKNLMRLLQSSNIVVYTAHSLAGAKRRLDEFPVDFLITDDQLPDGSGFELVKYMNENSSQTARFCVLTGREDIKTRQKYQAAGAELFLVKPASSNQIRDWVLGPLSKSNPERHYESAFNAAL